LARMMAMDNSFPAKTTSSSRMTITWEMVKVNPMIRRAKWRGKLVKPISPKKVFPARGIIAVFGV
jgi:hypothetical protein